MIIFLHGSDTYRSREKLSQIKNKFLLEKDRNNLLVSSFQAENLTINGLKKAILTASLFSNKKLIIVERLFSQTKLDQSLIKEIINLIKQFKSDNKNTIIFWDENIEDKKLTAAKRQLYNLLQKEKYSYEFKTLTPSQLRIWIKKYLAEEMIKIDDKVIDYFLGLTGNSLWLIKNELDKLRAYIKESAPNKPIVSGTNNKVPTSEARRVLIINMEGVQKIVLNETLQNIWKLVDAIGVKNKKIALGLLDNQFKNKINIDYLISILAHQYRTILKIKLYLDRLNQSFEQININELARKLNLHPFVCQKGLQQEKNYGLEEIKKIYHELVKIDFLRKSKSLDARALLSLLIVKS